MGNIFEELNMLNVSEHIEKKKGGKRKNEETGRWEDIYLSYLSWPWAWAEAKKRFPDIHYEVIMHDGLPYVYDENTGYMVFTSITIEGITHMMWLPVMDSANKAMKSHPYLYTIKGGEEKEVAQATMFDINKTIMRCLVKNLAMFGLGLYIYSGEDLPETEQEDKPKTAGPDAVPTAGQMEQAEKNQVVAEASAKAKVIGYINRHQMSKESIEKICKLYKIDSIQKMNLQMCQHYINALEKNGGNIDE